MIPILVDTNAYAAWQRGISGAAEVIEAAPSLGLSVIVLGELLTGFKVGARFNKNIEGLNRFLASPIVEIVPIDRAIAERYANLSVVLRQTGTPIPSNDLWVAATALERGFAVFTHDSHFRAVPGLKIGSCLADFQAA